MGEKPCVCPALGLSVMFSLSAWLQTTRRCKSSFHTQGQHVFSHPLDFQALCPVWLYCHVLLCPSQQDSAAEENTRKALYSLCKRLFSFPTKNSGALLRNRTCPSWTCLPGSGLPVFVNLERVCCHCPWEAAGSRVLLCQHHPGNSEVLFLRV